MARGRLQATATGGAERMDYRMTKSTGMVITLHWSKQGKWVERKRDWGNLASKSCHAERVGEDVWLFPKSVPHTAVHGWLEERLTAADRAIVAFPHGEKEGASSMSVHTYNV
jgi:hypothetical protein